MRKMNKRNKLSFNIFGVLVIAALAIFTFVMIQSWRSESESYTVAKDSVVYDAEKNLVDMPGTGTVQKRWNGNYYMSLENSGEYDLGKHSVIYDGSKSEVSILGDGYQVFTDGSVKNISKKTDIQNMNDIMFFKLDDRHYLLTGATIASEEEGFTTGKYLDITMDKSGNALLTNDEVNMKTVNPMILTCGEVAFDIANEKLLYAEQVVDLKAINGSTNEYVAKKDADEEEESGDDEDADGTKGMDSSIVNNNNTSNSSTTSNQQNVTVQGGGGGGAAGGAGTGTGNGTGSDGTGGNTGSGNGSNNGTSSGDKNFERSISLRGVSATPSSIKVNYSIIDIENKYISTYLLVGTSEDDDEATRIELNKADTEMEVSQLSGGKTIEPNKKYYVTLGYDMYVNVQGTATLTNFEADVVAVRTKPIKASISIDKVGATKLYYTVKLDPDYVLDSAKVKMYLGNSDQPEDDGVDINISKAVTDEGWSSTFDITGTSSGRIKLKIEDASRGGEQVDMKTECTVTVSRLSSYINRVIRWFTK